MSVFQFLPHAVVLALAILLAPAARGDGPTKDLLEVFL
jgi:hypothetical protein